MKEIEAIRAALDSEVKGYGNLNHVWGADKDEDGIFLINIVGANVDGDLYPVLEIDTAQYFQEEDGPKLAKYYAAVNPAAMAAVLAHIEEQAAEIERLTECLKKANAQTEHFEREWYLRGDEIERLRDTLKFYAEGDHFSFDRDAWDTVSDEPQNFWCDEAGTATVEDGTIAKLALAAVLKETP